MRWKIGREARIGLRIESEFVRECGGLSAERRDGW